jgi:D-alanyl-D-alanine carboxypeptidase
MKTGFTCPSGFNLVALAQRGHRRLIAVVMGYDTYRKRDDEAAKLLTEAFRPFTFWRVGEDVRALQPVPGPPPNLRSEVCSAKHQPVADGDDAEPPITGLVTTADAADGLLKDAPPLDPVPIFLGPPPGTAGAKAAAAAPPLHIDWPPKEPLPAPHSRHSRHRRHH